MDRYESLSPIDRERAEWIFASGSRQQVEEAILRAALHDTDPDWVTDCALGLLSDSDVRIRVTAATALGHVARVHGDIDVGRVVPALNQLKDDPQACGRAEDALDDIAMFARSYKKPDGPKKYFDKQPGKEDG